MCQWYKNFAKRLSESPFLQIPPGLEILKGIGDFHVRGHVPECYPRFALLYTEGAGVIDGEIVETLWAVLNQTSPSTRGATLAHRTEVLDDHMNHSNWRKLIGTGMFHMYMITCPDCILVSTLIQKLKRGRKLLKANEKAFWTLDESASVDQKNTWRTAGDRALAEKNLDPEAMDYFSLKINPGLNTKFSSNLGLTCYN